MKLTDKLTVRDNGIRLGSVKLKILLVGASMQEDLLIGLIIPPSAIYLFINCCPSFES
jgi:hypothetical protein